jgi:hypothetical protein
MSCVAGERLTSYQRVVWSVCRPVEDVNNVTSIGARDLDPDDAPVLEAEHG